MTEHSPASVARDLAKIEDMATRLEQRAIDRARDHEMPGGEATVAGAPVASLMEWTEQVEAAEWKHEAYPERFPAADTSDEDPDEMWPPLQVLWSRSEGYRKRLGMVIAKPTLCSESRFLRGKDVADWILAHEGRYDAYAGDVATAKSKLETILMEGDRAERSRVVCPDCDAGRPLIRQWADRRPSAWQCDGCGERTDQTDAGDDPCPRCEAPAMRPIAWESDEAEDRWKCPACRHRFSAAEVDDAYTKQMRSAGVDRWVPVSDALSLMQSQGWQERTIWAWFESGDLELSRDPAGRQLVWWPDVWRTHNTARMRRKEQERKAADLRLRKWICLVDHGEDCWIPRRGCAVVLSEITAV